MSDVDPDLTIVTGGAGFIGGHLVEILVQSGRRVRVVEHPNADIARLPSTVEVVRADIRDRAAVRDAVRGGRWVYHLAANPNLWTRDRRDFDAVNHQGAVHVIDESLAAGAERILHTSTESILTRARGREAIDEDVEVEPADAVGPYCLSKLLAERAAFERARAGSPVVVANPTMPVGPRDPGLSPPTRLIRDFCRGRLPAMMECTLNLIDVRDVAEGLIRVMERGRTGRRYLLGGENLDLSSLFAVLSELSGVPVPSWRIPYTLGLATAWLSELWADHVSGATPQATLTGVRLTRRMLHFNSTRSRDELSLKMRPIRQSLADAVDWLRDSGQLLVLNRSQTARPSRRNTKA
ncbi:MAG: NAD-dependent epimerase/dehydratase family protein [Planctomycetota bacterium]|nr:NAD-dependent epimerase/dehydratase family protein [Planctomycetota bacterium]